MEIFRRFLAVLAGDIFRDRIHRARAIERDKRDEIVDVVRAHLAQQIAHALTFELEHAHAVAARQHLVRGFVLELDVLGVENDAAALEQFFRLRNHRQRLEAEEVELHQPGLFRVLIVELRHRHFGTRIAIERHDLVERPVADHHACRMGRRVPVQALDLLDDGEKFFRHRFLFGDLLKSWLGCERVLHRHRLAGRIGHRAWRCGRQGRAASAERARHRAPRRAPARSPAP